MKKTQHEKNIPCFDHDVCLFQELGSLAEKMESDCYSGEKNSKKIRIDFLIGLARIRSKIHEHS